MYKQMRAFMLTSSLLFSLSAIGSHTFAGLKKAIVTSADQFIANSLSSLDLSEQLVFLHIVVDPTSTSVEATMKCFETLQSNEALAPACQDFATELFSFVQNYQTDMYKKFQQYVSSLKKTDEATMKRVGAEFSEKMEEKMYELMAFFQSIYYERIYRHIEQQDPAALFFMFDEEGMIAVEKRVKPLPLPGE